MIRRLILVIFAGTLILNAGTTRYVLEAWNVDIAELTLDIREHPDREDLEIITYHVRTIGVLSALYRIDNLYEFTVDRIVGRPVAYRKVIHQFNMDLDYSEWRVGDSLFSSYGQVVTDSEWSAHPLLLILRRDLYGNGKPVPVRIEGELYDCILKPEAGREESGQREYRLLLNYRSGNKWLEKTDVFTWKLCDPEAGKSVFYDAVTGELTAAGFTLRGIRVLARRSGDAGSGDP